MVKHDKVNKEKTKKNNSGLVISIIIGIVLVAFLSAIFIFDPADDNSPSRADYETYNGFKFEQRGDFWLTFVELGGVPYEAPFYNHPLNVLDIPYQENITNFMLRTPHTDFTIAVSDGVGAIPVLAGANIARITGRLYGMPTASALFATPDERDENQTTFRYVDCTDATSLSPIIWINPKAESQGVYTDSENNNCIVIAGTNNDEVLESSDVFIYKVLQIN